MEHINFMCFICHFTLFFLVIYDCFACYDLTSDIRVFWWNIFVHTYIVHIYDVIHVQVIVIYIYIYIVLTCIEIHIMEIYELRNSV